MQRRLTAILAADVVGFSRLAAADEEGTVSRLRALRHELIDPVIAAHNGRTFKTTGDGWLTEFASVVDAVRAALEMQRGMAARNANVAAETRIEFRVGIHLGDVIVESDGDLMGDGVNIAARLEGIGEPGGICLSNAAYEQVRDKIAADFADLGEKELKNIARPVRVYAISPPSVSSPSPTRGGGEGRDEVGDSRVRTTTSPSHRSATGPSLSATRRGEEGPPRLSIVVLPLMNIGGDPEQDHFVDGVTESLTTDLSRIRNSFVIARNTAFSYKGKPLDIKQIGGELNVRYVLEGSVQRGGNRMRVNVQLIDTETGNHLWAERFDKPLADLFDMQDEIVARLANQMGTQLVTAEARRAEQAVDPDSMDLYFRAQAVLHGGINATNFAEGKGLFERSIAFDPSNVDALVGFTFFLMFATATGTGGDRMELFRAATAAATKGTALAPDFAPAHAALGYVYALSGQADKAIAEGERALELDPNCEFGHGSIAIAKLRCGKAAEVEPHVMNGLRLNPRGFLVYGWYLVLGMARLYLGEYREALPWLTRSVEANRNYPLTHFHLAAALAKLGNLEEAETAVQAGLALEPDFAISRYNASPSSDDPVFSAQRERVIDGMRQAGVPEE